MNRALSILLTLFMLGSSSGMASFQVMEPSSTPQSPEITVDSVEVDITDEAEPSAEPAIAPAEVPVGESQPAPSAPDETLAPEGTESDANPSTGPPAEDSSSIDELTAPEAPIQEQAEPAADEVEIAPANEPGEPLTEEESSISGDTDVPASDVEVATKDVVESIETTEPDETSPEVTEPSIDGDGVDDDNTDVIGEESSAPIPTNEPPRSAASITPQSTDVPVTITVLDWNTDLPISGATIQIYDFEGDVRFDHLMTDGSGTATASLPLVEGMSYNVDAEAPGYFGESSGFDFWEGDTSIILTMYLSPNVTGTASITVLDLLTDVPVSGVTIAITDTSGAAIANGVTDANGVFTTSSSLAGGTYFFKATRDGYQSESSSIYIEGNSSETVYLSPILSGDVTYKVYDATTDNMDPLAGVSVTILGDNDEILASGTTDPDGIVILEDLPGGIYTATATLTGYQPAERQVHIQGDVSDNFPMFPNASPDSVTITALESGSLNPISGATVIILDQSDTAVATGTTDVDGVFTSEVLPVETYDIRVTHTDYHDAEINAVSNIGGANQDVFMKRKVSGTATVTVLDSETDDPLANAKVTVSLDDLASDLVLTTDSSGAVAFPANSEGVYTLNVELAGYNDGYTTFIYDGENMPIVYLRALEPGTATITVRDIDGNALLDGVKVEVMDWDTEASIFTDTTDTSGKITTGELPEGIYKVKLTKDGYFSVDQSIIVSGESEETYFMELEKTGALTIHVLAPNDVPIADANVSIFHAVANGMAPGGGVHYELGELEDTGTTNANGTMVTSDLTSGSYFVVIEADGFEFFSRVVHVNGAATYPYNLTVGTNNPTPEPSETPVVTPVTPVVTPVTPVVTPVTPEPSETPIVTPVTPVVTPETPVVTPVTPDVTPETPVVTPVTPVETPNTPGEDDEETPVETPGETPIETPGTPDEDSNDTPNETPPQMGTLTIGFGLCADDDCETPNTQYDGYTMTWTVTPLETASSQVIANARIASVGMIGQPITIAAMQQSQSVTVTGVIQDGIAIGVSPEIPVGRYQVCLNPVITGPNGETASIANAEICTDLTLDVDGNSEVLFSGVAGSIVAEEPAEVPATDTPTIPGSDSPAPPAKDTVANSATTAMTAAGSGESDGSSVNQLPSTGSGTVSEKNGGFVFAAACLLLLAIGAFGSRKFSQRG